MIYFRVWLFIVENCINLANTSTVKGINFKAFDLDIEWFSEKYVARL